MTTWADLLLSLVSFGVMAGAAIVKIPQIVNVVRAGSARGLSLPSLYLETLATLAGTIYNLLAGNPFRSYGETALILIQNVIIVVLAWRTTTKPTPGYVAGAVAVFLSACVCMWHVESLQPLWPSDLLAIGFAPLDAMYAAMTLLYIVSRVRLSCACVCALVCCTLQV